MERSMMGRYEIIDKVARKLARSRLNKQRSAARTSGRLLRMQPFFGNASPIGRSNLRSPLEEVQNREREGAARASFARFNAVPALVRSTFLYRWSRWIS